MEQKILQIFYQEVIKEAAQGRIYIDDWIFNIGFSTKLEGIMLSQYQKGFETLEINNQEKFNQKLIEYTNTLLDWFLNYPNFKDCDSLYFDGNINHIIKNCLSSVWSNATVDDFKNPEMYLQRCIDFLNMDGHIKSFSIESNPIVGLDNSQIVCKVVSQNPANHESPYVFESQITSQMGVYPLPSISFGISNQVCYIMAIQGKKNRQKDDLYTKKINRLLYKVNKDVNESYDEERIQDISSSQLVSMICFLNFLKIVGIQNIVANSYFPIRYHAKEMVIQKVSHLTEGEKENQLSELYENIVNKFLRIIRRVAYHFPEIEIDSFPFELDSTTHITISNFSKHDSENLLVYEINNSFDYLLNDRKEK